MAFAQTTYADAPAIGLPGQVANEEKANRISRSVESAAGIAFGQPAYRGAADHGVVAGAAFAATAAASAKAGNTGTGTITAAPSVVAGAKPGRYTITLMETSATGAWDMEDPDGRYVGSGKVATAATIDGIGVFTIANGGTMTKGDVYYIDVTYTANADFLGMAILTPAVPGDASSPDAYPQYFTGGFLTMGQMYVTAGATVAPGDPVYWNSTSKRFTNTATDVRIPDAVFDTSAVDGGIVEISLKSR